MNGYATPSRIAFSLAVFLGSLTVVAWRQGQALTVMEEIEDLRAEISLADAENDEVRQRIQRLQGRSWVTEQAAERLGMSVPEASAQQFLEGVVQ